MSHKRFCQATTGFLELATTPSGHHEAEQRLSASHERDAVSIARCTPASRTPGHRLAGRLTWQWQTNSACSRLDRSSPQPLAIEPRHRFSLQNLPTDPRLQILACRSSPTDPHPQILAYRPTPTDPHLQILTHRPSLQTRPQILPTEHPCRSSLEPSLQILSAAPPAGPAPCQERKHRVFAHGFRDLVKEIPSRYNREVTTGASPWFSTQTPNVQMRIRKKAVTSRQMFPQRCT